MGYMRHHAIVVTAMNVTWRENSIEVVHARAVSLFGDESVSALGPEQTNGYRTFVVYPDGSKEGWEESHAGDRRREAFKTWLREVREKHYVDWVEVQFGDDERQTMLVDDSDSDAREVTNAEEKSKPTPVTPAVGSQPSPPTGTACETCAGTGLMGAGGGPYRPMGFNVDCPGCDGTGRTTGKPAPEPHAYSESPVYPRFCRHCGSHESHCAANR